MYKKTIELTHNQRIIDQAHVIRTKFNAINDAFRDIHILISHTKPISSNMIPKIQNHITTYMNFFCKHFPGKVTPKQHFLEKHCVQWIQTYGFGMGFHAEQGGELIHATVARLERRAIAVRNE